MTGKKQASGGTRDGAGRKPQSLKVSIGDSVTVDGVCIGVIVQVERGSVILQTPDGRTVRVEVER